MLATKISYLIQTDSCLNYQPNHVFVNPRRRSNGFIFTNPNLRISNLSSLLNTEIKSRVSIKLPRRTVNCRNSDSDREMVETDSSMDCVGTGYNVECIVDETSEETDQFLQKKSESFEIEEKDGNSDLGFVKGVLEWGLLISPFFFWGTAMVAMKEVFPKAGPFFVSAFRLIPAGFMLVAFAGLRGRKQPSGVMVWVSIVLFGLVDAACFQGFLAEGLQRTSAGLGSVIIDSQPLTVAILASLLFGESIGVVGAAGLVLGVVGLLLLELPALSLEGSNSSLWGSGEWWMLLAAQSMAVGTVMVRWVSKYSDPIMATGWGILVFLPPKTPLSRHYRLGEVIYIPQLVQVSPITRSFCTTSYGYWWRPSVGHFHTHDPAISGGLKELNTNDILALIYTSIFGSAISYGVYFYNASRGQLLSIRYLYMPMYLLALPMFAVFLYLGETFSELQIFGALVTVVAIYMVNYRTGTSSNIE
ncbi:hypothetical protein MKW98_007059 [Papaver atlanticum]|uniref:EamA domain-containing protein n=1 Tax=Papaver atlanticum TaxID=357466 RepID=A0AAD4SVL1_9MAGN|nr:hypothetical protein MKW98_007059 [Papaver atlanticum]